MKNDLDILLEWLESFDGFPIGPHYRNVVEKIWELKSKEYREYTKSST